MNRKKCLLLALALTASVMAGISTAKEPPDGQEYDYVYFSSPAKTTMVGGRRVGCGLDQSWGSRTGVFTLTVVPCTSFP